MTFVTLDEANIRDVDFMGGMVIASVGFGSMFISNKYTFD